MSKTVKGRWVFALKLDTADPDEIARNLRLVADHVSTGRMRADQHAAIVLRTILGREIGIAIFEME